MNEQFEEIHEAFRVVGRSILKDWRTLAAWVLVMYLLVLLYGVTFGWS